MTDAVAAKTDLQPAPGGLLDFAKFLTGSKTSGSENVSGSQATQGQTGPLEAILAQLSDPNGLTNLVQGLFAKGALQVPGLTAQYANATGTRTSNNAMLGQSLAQLNQSLASSISDAVVNQQKVAADAAAKLADINKTSTTAKSGTTVSSSKPADLKTGIATGAGTVLGGTLINTLAKKFNLGGAKDAAGADSTSSVPALPTDFSGSPVQGFGDAAPFVDANVIGSAGNDVLPSFSGADLEPIDIPTGDGVDSVSPDVSADSPDVAPDVDVTPDVGPEDVNFWDDFGEFFANGGIVLAHHSSMKGSKGAGKGTGGAAAKASSKYADGGEIENYADGGVIDSGITAPLRRNTPNFGPAQQVQSTGAINIKPSITASPSTGVGASKKRVELPAQNSGDGTLGEESSSNAAEAPSTPGMPSLGPISAANAALGLAKATSLSALGPIGLGLGFGLLSTQIAKEIARALSGSTGEISGTFGQEALTSMTNVDSLEDDGVTGSPPDADSGLGPDDNGVGGFDGSDGSTEGGNSAADNANNDNDSSSGFGAGEGSSDGDGDGEGDGGGDGGGGEANGGVQKAASIKEASGIDKKTIHVTPGEYVLPVDVTQALGVDMLDELVAHLHTPIGTKNVTNDVARGRD